MNQNLRSTDKSILAQIANSPSIVLMARAASILMAFIISLLVFIAQSSLKTLDKVETSISALSEKVIRVVTQVEEQQKRIEKVENKVFR